jgi:hypothetical protein
VHFFVHAVQRQLKDAAVIYGQAWNEQVGIAQQNYKVKKTDFAFPTAEQAGKPLCGKAT